MLGATDSGKSTASGPSPGSRPAKAPPCWILDWESGHTCCAGELLEPGPGEKLDPRASSDAPQTSRPARRWRG
ncbi:MAG TPA: hypothetical protein EYP33_06740 [Pyrodictium sp.]|nr:hypothetical protein [Pyrodictium sp.]